MGVTIAVSVITAVVAAAGTYLGTYLNNISLLFPRDVTHDVVEAFNRLKARQADLLEPRRPLRGRKTRANADGDYTAELEDYIKRYERDAQLEEEADGQSSAASGHGYSTSAFREADPGRR